MTPWPDIHRRVVEAFAAGWQRPHPHAWDELLAEDVVLGQPLLRSGNGLRLWQQEVDRLLTFLPDIHGEVSSWAGRDDVVFIRIRLSATAGGKPLSFTAVDQLHLDAAGVVVGRESFFDPTPVLTTLLKRPRTWGAWWRSGLGPLLGRRRFLTS